MRLPHDSVVLVADGAKMLLFRNEGDGEYPVLKVIAAEQQRDERDRDIKRDLSGQAPDVQGAGGATMGEADFHQQNEDNFAVEAAERLKQGALAGDYQQIAVVASPRTLGMLRQHYHSEVEKRLILELAKDLTGHPVDKIEEAIAKAE
jgi:protein required for attachment to host cells